MSMGNLSIVERKTLGALMVICCREGYTTTTTRDIAERMGYKTPGGIITAALRMLEMKNMISIRLNQRNMSIMVLQ